MIDMLFEPDFAEKKLEWQNVQIDYDKLIVGGHSFGGMTAINSSERDQRIKATFGFDPWLWVRIDEIQKD